MPKTYVLHGVHLEEKPRDCNFVSAVGDSPEKLAAWLREQFKQERDEQIADGYDEDDLLPEELLRAEFVDESTSFGGWWTFHPENWPYFWEITEVPVVS